MRSDTDAREARSWSRFARVALAVAVMASTLAVVPAMAQENQQTFIVEQGGQCIQVTPLGDGSQSVEAFYDYRSPVMNQMGLYSSYGTTEIQQSQVSQVFVYRGSEGLSLVFLHDKFGDETGGFVATADISGLPSKGEWVVEDDTYNTRNDVFRYSDGSAHIEWGSNGNRTDGAAFRGLRSSNYSTITVDMKFNEGASQYPYGEWDSPPEQNQIERWVVRSGTGETTELDMSEPIQISPGTCSGGISTFTATPGDSGTVTSTDAETTASTAAPTQATATPPPTETPTATPSETPTATPTTTPPSATNETTDATETGGTTTASQSGDGGGSGAFGPGFGVTFALVALVALAVVALARRTG